MLAPHTTPTAFLLIDLQLGLTHPTSDSPARGPRSTPALEQNITTLLRTVRAYNANINNSIDPAQTPPAIPISIIHVHHHSLHPTSTLHPSYTIPSTTEKGTSPLRCAAPLDAEPVITKSVNSSFVNTDLEERLRNARIKQIIVVGLTTEHCVSTTVRMAANLDVCGYGKGDGEGLVLVGDGTGCWGKKIGGRGGNGGGEGRWIEAEMVHAVELECLRGEFAEVVETEDVVRLVVGKGEV